MVRGRPPRKSGPASSSSGAFKQSPSRVLTDQFLTEDEKHHAHESDEHEDNCASDDEGSGGRSSGKGASHQRNPRNANEEAALENVVDVDLCESQSDVDTDQKGNPPTTKESRPSSSTSQQRKRNRTEKIVGEQNSREGADESDFEEDKHFKKKKKKRETDVCSDASSQSSKSASRKQENGGKATKRISSTSRDEESKERKPLLHSPASSITSSVRFSESSNSKRTSKQKDNLMSWNRNGQNLRRRAGKRNERDGRGDDKDMRKGVINNQSEKSARVRNRGDRRAPDNTSDSDDEDESNVKVAAQTHVDDSDSDEFQVKSSSTKERARESEDEKNEDDDEGEDVATRRETKSKRRLRATRAAENQSASGGAPRSAEQGIKFTSRAKTSGSFPSRDVDTSSRAQPERSLMGSHAMAESESTSDGQRNDAHDSPSANALPSPTRSGSPKLHDTFGHATSASQDDSSMDEESEPSIPQVHVAMKVKFYGICRNEYMGKHSETWEGSGMRIIGVYADKSSAQAAIEKDKEGLLDYPYDADGVCWEFLCLEAKHFGGAQ